MNEIKHKLGVKGVRRISESTTVVEFEDGGAMPLTPFAVRMWDLLEELTQ